MPHVPGRRKHHFGRRNVRSGPITVYEVKTSKMTEDGNQGPFTGTDQYEDLQLYVEYLERLKKQMRAPRIVSITKIRRSRITKENAPKKVRGFLSEFWTP